MSLEIKPTEIPEVLVISKSRFKDDRGFFGETFREKELLEHDLPSFVQENHSYSKPGTIRGLHYQLNPRAQGKLVYCVSGIIVDFAVDIRVGSPTYGKYVRVVLNGSDPNITEMVYVPPGFAHGFHVPGASHVVYKVTNYYSKEHERCIRWNDVEIGIQWNEDQPRMSQKDMDAPLLKGAENNFIYGE